MNASRLLPFAFSASLLLLAASCANPSQAVQGSDAMAADGMSDDAMPSCCAGEEDAPMATAMTTEAAALPQSSLYQIDASWQDQADATRRPSDLRGKVVVTAMIFTHCQYACPLILADLKKMEAQLSPEVLGQVEWLLVSMDADRDTPPVLATYAEERGLDLARWTLWHGDAATVRTWAAALGVNYRKDANGNFSHTNLITVLDREGRVAYRLDGLNAPAEDCLAAIRQEAGR